MKKKICVYAICKNEMKFVDRWLSSLYEESDYIVVLDTGSTDGTFEFLQQDPRVHRVKQQIITPWRFDTARNESLKLIPYDTDICVVSDFDQTFRPGWGDELRQLFDAGYEEVYGDIIDYDDDNKEIKRFLSKNVHPRQSEWYWERPIHEGISYHGDREVKAFISDKFVIEHHPDYTKSRGNYLNILEAEYEENHADPMCAIYYGCELCFHGRTEEGLRVFLRANEECDYSSCPDIGCQIQLNIADEYYSRGQYDLALPYALSAMEFGVITRRLYMQIANIYYALNDYDNSYKYMILAFNHKHNERGWVELSMYFEGMVEDQLSIVCGARNDYIGAIAFASLALSYHPEDERIKNNLNWFINQEVSKNV